MIPPTTKELKQHSNDIANFGKNLRKLNGPGNAFVNAVVVVFAVITVAIFMTPIAMQIV